MVLRRPDKEDMVEGFGRSGSRRRFRVAHGDWRRVERSFGRSFFGLVPVEGPGRFFVDLAREVCGIRTVFIGGGTPSSTPKSSANVRNGSATDQAWAKQPRG